MSIADRFEQAEGNWNAYRGISQREQIRTDLIKLDRKTAITRMGCDTVEILDRIEEAWKQYIVGLITIDEAIAAVNR